MNRSKTLRMSLAAASVIGCVGVGAIALAAASGDDERVDNDRPSRTYPMNDNGLTYGSALGATSPEDEPDLIMAYGIDGTLGYVLKRDLYGTDPASPEEAAARSGLRETIPLYAQDGVTIIGEFVLESGKGGSEVTAP